MTKDLLKLILAGTFACTLLCFTQQAKAQLDTSFWFVAPEVTAAHPNGSSPVRFNFATDDMPATVIVTQPAGAGAVATLNIPANSAQSLDLENLNLVDIGQTMTLDHIENRPANTVLNQGFFIQSSAPITAYYEVNTQGNPDIFALKGSNALGLEFYTPFQNEWSNANDAEAQNPNWNPAPKSAFDIVATEDNTTITITLPNNADIVGHSAGSSFTITLNRGQTWSGEAVSGLNTAHPGGTHIVADKPIAVTVKDDSVYEGDPDDVFKWCWDLMGDQLIPVSILGKEYVINKGFLRHTDFEADWPWDVISADTTDRAFIVATEDNTDIFINGAAFPSASLNAGETYNYQVSEQSTYVLASAPVYVLHASGNGCEIGQAVLPPVDNCTGSRKVFFTRAQDEALYLTIMVREEFKDGFTLNGDALAIQGSDFESVPGTNGEWVAALITYDKGDTFIPINESSVIENSQGLFHFGFINGPKVDGGTRYGYFSSFNGLEIGGNSDVCATDSVLLDAGDEALSYEWSTGASTQTVLVNDPGTYWVRVNQGGCINVDTVEVVFQPPLNPTIATDDSTICENASTILDAGDGFFSYLWSTGETTQTITVEEQNDYQVTVTNVEGCVDSDDIGVTTVPLPSAFIELNDVILCLDSTTTIGTAGYSAYAWSSGQTTESIEVSHEDAGTFILTVTDDEFCQGSDTIQVIYSQVADPSIPDATICPGDSVTLESPNTYASYAWFMYGDTPTLTTSDSGAYNLMVHNEDGCPGFAHISVALYPPVDIDLPLADVEICPNETADLTPGDYAGYLWSNGATTGTITVNEVNVYAVTVFDDNACTAVDSMLLTHKDAGTLTDIPDTVVCEGYTVNLSPGSFDSYVWSNGATTAIAEFDAAGNYSVTVTDEKGCTGTDDFSIANQALPVPNISNASICPDSNLTLNAGEGFVNYVWSTGATTQSITVSTPNDYTVVVIDPSNCMGSATMTLSEYTPSSSGLSDESVCESKRLTLTPNNFQSYLWSTGETTRTIDASGGGSFELSFVDLNGCPGADSVYVTFFEVTELPAFEEQRFCQDSVLELTVPAIYSSYEWSTGATTHSIEVANSGEYSVEVIDDNGCDQSATIPVEQNSAPTAVFLEDLICNNDPDPGIDIQLMGQAPFSITYQLDGVVQLPIAGIADSVYTFRHPQVESYQIMTIKDGSGCPGSGNGNIVPITHDSVRADFIMDPIIPQCDYVDIFFQDNSFGSPMNHTWIFDGDTVTEINPGHRFSYDTQSTFSYIIENANGCTDTISETLDIESFGEFFEDYFQPINVFTPGNNDGMNDEFDIDPLGYYDECIEMTIYDRWGLKMYVTEIDNPENAWRGVTEIGNAPGGTYYYIGLVKNIPFNGYLTLFRD